MDLKNIRISDIAKLAGVSTGTVDRVLHNRGRVSEEKRRLVEQVLKEMDYRPNPLARTLANHRQLHLVTLTPEYAPGEYWELVNRGIQAAAEGMLPFNVRVEQRFFNQYDEDSFRRQADLFRQDENPLRHEADLFRQDEDSIRSDADPSGVQAQAVRPTMPDGVVIATLFEAASRALAAVLDQAGVPYVLIDSSLEGAHQLAYFGVDSYQSGRLAAHLLYRSCAMTPLLTIAYAGHEGTLSLQSRMRQQGFRAYLQEKGMLESVHALVFEDSNRQTNGRMLQEALITLQPRALVVFNSRAHEVVSLLTPEQAESLLVVGYDAIEANLRALREGRLAWLIGQQASRQGSEAVDTLCQYLLFERETKGIHYLPIDVLTQENLPFE